jgi:hypothetical protein
MSIYQLVNNFNAGELSPLVDVRADTGKYRTGCRLLRNFIPRAVGGAFSRPGMEYMGRAKYPDRKCRLEGFNFSVTTNFQLEFGHEYIRFWSNRQQVQLSSAPAWVTATAYAPGDYVTEAAVIYYCLAAHTSGVFATDLAADQWVAQTVYEVPSPYAEADLFEIQVRQINDITYLVHPGYAPRKLSRLGDTDWRLEEITWDWPALLDENTEATTITPSATTGSVTLTASAALFEPGHVGAYYQLAHRRQGAFVELGITANATSATTLRVIGRWEFATAGTWNAQVHIDRSEDNGVSWETVRTFKAVSDRNVAPISYDEPTEVLLRLRITGYVSNTSARCWLEAVDSKVYGLVRVTAYSSATVVTATVVRELAAATATKLWSEGAWSTRQGYPRAVTFHEQRVIYGGTAREPVRVWGSAIGDFENFRKSTLDDSSFDYVLASTQSSQIQWMCANSSGLIIGTAAEEWLMGSGSETEPITPTNVRVIRQSTEGSEYLAARLIKNVVLFIQRYGRTLSEMAYSFEEDSLRANDMTILSEHVTEGGIKQTAYQSRKDAILWAVTGTGRLIGLTYERQHEVSAWHVHETAGAVESVSVGYSASGTADEAWFVVQRVVNGQTVRFIESFHPALAAVDYSDPARFVCQDAAVTYDGAPVTVVTGLDHLEGEEVVIRADGGTHPPRTVAGGQITLDYAASVVVAGLAYTPLLQPMKSEVQMPDGSSRGRKFRASRLVLSVYRTLGGQITHDPTSGQYTAIPFRDAADPIGEPPPLKTDDVEWDVDSPHQSAVNVAIRQTDPQPLNLLAMVIIFDVHG